MAVADPAANPNPGPKAVAAAAKPAAVESWTTKTFSRDDLKTHAGLGKFKTVDDFGASYLALEKKLGDKNQRSLPGPEATEAERTDFYKWLGAPEGADKYSLYAPEKIKELLPEGTPILEPFVKNAFETFHKVGLSDAQASAVVSFFAKEQGAAMEAEGAQILAGVEEVKKEWGHAYEERLAVAGRAIDQLADGENKIPGLAELMDPEKGDPRFGSNPALIRLFYWLGTLMGEDKLVDGNQRTEEQVGDLKGKITELMKPGGPYWNERDPQHKKYVEDVQRYNQELHGNAKAA